MATTEDDPRIQERISKLNLIVARRNEFLRELFALMHWRLDDGNASGDDEGLHAFVQRFNLLEEPVRGSILNLQEEEALSFYAAHMTMNQQSDIEILSAELDPNPREGKRATRSRSRAAESITPPSASAAKPQQQIIAENRLPKRPEAPATRGDRLVSPIRATRSTSSGVPRQTEESDEDHDELDLIGSTAFSDEERRQPARVVSQELLFIDHSLTAGPAESNRQMSPSTEGQVSPIEAHAHPITQDASMESECDQTPSAKGGEEPVETPLIPDEDRLLLETAEPHNAMDVTLPQPQELCNVEVPLKIMVEQGPPASPQPKPTPPPSAPPTPQPLVQGGCQLPGLINQGPIQIVLPPSIHEDIIIPAPSANAETSTYQLDIILEAETTQPIASPRRFRQQCDHQYTLPPVNILPVEFTRRTKSKKLKKDKEREKSDGKRDKDDVPMGINRWHATLMANPVWKKVSRASKCLSTREWGIAMAELKLIRTLERIESLKDDGRWSFRQPKKQRGVGGLVKTHWDYLMEEMKWMRIDFREERRWKMAMAYHLSTAVLEWHAAGTATERWRAGICVKWQPFLKDTAQIPSTEDIEVEVVQEEQTGQSLLGVDYGSDDEDEDEQMKEPGDIANALEPASLIEDALESAMELQLKNEDVDDQSALHLVGQIPDSSDGDNFGSAQDDPKLSVDPTGLKETSNDPLLGSKSSSQSADGDQEATHMSKLPKSILVPLQEKIAYASDDELFIGFNSDFEIPDDPSEIHNMSLLEFPDLNTIFPDLQPLTLLNVVSPNPPAEVKKRAEKRSDRDDPHRRIEDVTYAKLYPTGRFMFSKPTLLGPLQPAKRWKDGKWLPVEENQTAPLEAEGHRAAEDINNGRTNNTSANFQTSLKDKNMRKQGANDHLWSTNDDVLLKSLVDKYSTNWNLIAECYNSSRLTTPTDRRGATDCLERYTERWGTERKYNLSEVVPADENVMSGSSNQMTTRGVKRLASVSFSSQNMQGIPSGNDSKKRRRHILLQESIRKASKKRGEAAQKQLANQRKPSAVHETHNQYNKLPKLTPIDLSRMKADKDMQSNQDLALARRRQQEEQARVLLREQSQRLGGIPASQAQQQQQASQAAPQPQPSQAQPQLQPPQPAQQPVQHPHTQLAQLQQLQQAQRSNTSPASVPGRPPRLATTLNARPNSQQAQHLQQARPIQVPGQLATGTQVNIAPVNPTGTSTVASNGFYPLPPNMTQEQLLMLALQTAQHQLPQQQQQPQQSNHQSPNGFVAQP